jgi:hypothetical protein
MRRTIAGLSAAVLTTGLLADCSSPPPPTPSQRFATSMAKVGLYPKHGRRRRLPGRRASATASPMPSRTLAGIGAWSVVIDDGLVGRAAARRCPIDSRISSDPEASFASPAINGCVHLDAWTWLPDCGVLVGRRLLRRRRVRRRGVGCLPLKWDPAVSACGNASLRSDGCRHCVWS